MIFCTLIALTACSPKEEEKKDNDFSEEEIQALSETMGHFFLENLHTQHLKLDINSLIRGIENAEMGAKPLLSKEEFFEMMTKYKNNLTRIKSNENLKIAEDFLSENRSEASIVSLKGGKIQYIILEQGGGPIIKERGSPLMNYEGKLIDGMVFDSTLQRGTPLRLSLNSTIPGFKEGMAGMRVGEKRRIYIHPDLGYGTAGRLPPNSLLIFDVEVLEDG